MVKPGYKQTEVGVIPEDWRCIRLGDIAKVTKLAGFEFTKYVVYSNQGDIIALRGLNVKNGKLILDDVKYIDGSDFSKLNRSKLFKDDLLFTYVGTVGEVALVDKNDKYYLAPNVALIRLSDCVDPTFCMKQILSTNFYKNEIQVQIATSSQPALSMANIRLFNVILPSLIEQKSIAEALSDVDSMISSLEKLISKKKAVKQGAMQELLTGKKRLPGFDGDIKYKSLASLCTVFADGDWIESKDQSNDGIRLIQTGNIGVGKYLDKTDKQRFISTDTFDRLKCLEIFENDVIVSRLPEPAGRACILPYSNKRRITAVDCTIIRFADYNPILFVAYSQTKQYQDKIDMAMAGSTRQRISRKELGEIPIPVFPTIEEQNALASIFSDMDNEIETLEQKLEKTRQLKQGMMQQLLTGKIRLV